MGGVAIRLLVGDTRLSSRHFSVQAVLEATPGALCLIYPTWQTVVAMRLVLAAVVALGVGGPVAGVLLVAPNPAVQAVAVVVVAIVASITLLGALIRGRNHMNRWWVNTIAHQPRVSHDVAVLRLRLGSAGKRQHGLDVTTSKGAFTLVVDSTARELERALSMAGRLPHP